VGDATFQIFHNLIKKFEHAIIYHIYYYFSKFTITLTFTITINSTSITLVLTLLKKSHAIIYIIFTLTTSIDSS
jgi:hypothetical protein